MKFIVDELPYYGEFCPFWMMCSDNASDDKCPRYWNKYKVCSNDSPHECRLLVEAKESKKSTARVDVNFEKEQ